MRTVLWFSMLFRSKYSFFLSRERLSSKNDATSDNVNFRPDIGQNDFYKKSRHQGFVWFLP